MARPTGFEPVASAFDPRPGRIRHDNQGVRRPKSFVGEVMRAAKKAGHRGQSFRPSSGTKRRSTFGRGRRAALSPVSQPRPQGEEIHEIRSVLADLGPGLLFPRTEDRIGDLRDAISVAEIGRGLLALDDRADEIEALDDFRLPIAYAERGNGPSAPP